MTGERLEENQPTFDGDGELRAQPPHDRIGAKELMDLGFAPTEAGISMFHAFQREDLKAKTIERREQIQAGRE